MSKNAFLRRKMNNLFKKTIFTLDDGVYLLFYAIIMRVKNTF